MTKQLFSDFLGEGTLTGCEVDNEDACQFPTNCQDTETTGPYAQQACLAIAAIMNLSRLLSTVYQGLNKAQLDLDTIFPRFTQAFVNLPPASTNWKQIMEVTSTLLIPIGVGFISAGAEDLDIGGFVGASNVFGGAVNFANIGGEALPEEFTFESLAKHSTPTYNMIRNFQTGLKNMHNSYLKQGKGLADILSNEAFVQGGSVIANSDVISGVGAVAQWMKKTVITSLINEAWKESNAMIVLVSRRALRLCCLYKLKCLLQVPYGTVTNISKERTLTHFSVDDCRRDYLNNPQKGPLTHQTWGQTYFADCGQGTDAIPGMAVFYQAPKKGSLFDATDKSFFERKLNFDDWTFHPQDVLKASTMGYLGHGFN